MIAPVNAGPWPGEPDPVALHSRAYRDGRHAALARWAGIPEDGVDAFVARMELSWVRQAASEETEAAAAVVSARRARAREEGQAVRAPRIRMPRISVPRLA